MNYALSTARGLWNNTVAVPKIILEQHLKFASARQLKALLYMLSSGEETVSSGELASFLCCEAEELEDIMEYWFACGVVSRDQQTHMLAEQQKPEPSGGLRLKLELPELPAEPLKITKVMSVPRLSPKDVVNRGNEDASIAGLLREGQSVLCRTISHSEQEMLINMVDYYGLRPEVILMILAYAKGVGKANTRYILSMAKNWGDEGIDSVARAEQKLEEIALCDERWKTVCAIAELPMKTPTAKQRECTDRWLTQWGFCADLVGRAFDIAKDNEIKKTFPYVNKILQNWHENGIKTLSDLAKSEERQEKKTPATSSGGKGRITSEASYDIHQIEAESFAETLKFGG